MGEGAATAPTSSSRPEPTTPKPGFAGAVAESARGGGAYLNAEDVKAIPIRDREFGIAEVSVEPSYGGKTWQPCLHLTHASFDEPQKFKLNTTNSKKLAEALAKSGVDPADEAASSEWVRARKVFLQIAQTSVNGVSRDSIQIAEIN